MGEHPAHTRWTRYRANALGQTSLQLIPHPVYLALGVADHARRMAYRDLFRPHLDEESLNELRLALNPSQPLGDERFDAKIERLTEQWREARPRGRPRLASEVAGEAIEGQGELGL